MSDFLTRLAGRAMATAPVAQPLIPAKFASAPEPSGFNEVTEFGREPVAKQREATVSGTALDNQPRQIETRVTARRTPEPGIFAVPAGDRGETKRVEIPQAPPSESHPPQIAKPNPKPLTKADWKTETQIVLSDSIPRREPSHSAPEPSKMVTASRSVLDTHSTSNPPLRRAPQAAQKAPAPIVRVTIGRVDVRAEFPAAPAPHPKGRPAAQSLSLDDYLKLRNEGKR
jgi:hypothetical protein